MSRRTERGDLSDRNFGVGVAGFDAQRNDALRSMPKMRFGLPKIKGQYA